MQEAEGGEIGSKAVAWKSDLTDMKKMLTQLKNELEDEEGFNIVFHVSLLWPVTLINPGIKVLITLKDTHENEDVATWERIMHNTHTGGWESSLSAILCIAKEMDLDYLIMENSKSSENHTGWLQ
jgi:hypothetical protein